ncbi:hypothetical protein Taro_043629 [Colocasia esculenta]|uniref:Uncharacterized protein n=1 Tax=Colocasia esculenta TaxID=4460 RepID=A0A843WZ87_COLES|nr:hypothetical protein [Colocasia esculenta]
MLNETEPSDSCAKKRSHTQLLNTHTKLISKLSSLLPARLSLLFRRGFGGFELPHLALHQAAAAFTINYLHLLYVIPLEYTKDLVALRNLGFEFPSTKNNDYPRGSLAAQIGRYAWHVRTTDPCIPIGPDSPAFSNKLVSRVASLERWRSGERLGKIVVFLDLALHQPRNLQRVLSIQSIVSTPVRDVSTLPLQKNYMSWVVMRNQRSRMGQGKSDEHPPYE